MRFNIFRSSFYKIVLLPFSLLYGLIIIFRNILYDTGLLKSVSFSLPVIGVGNLSVGGTGKSPMVEYLLKMLQPRYKMAMLSRGYKRKTKGYVLAGTTTSASEIGDEPMQVGLKFPEVTVAVGEKRIEAIPKLLSEKPETGIIVLDDSFQHRQIKPGLNILLTAYSNLFTEDFFLPSGRLRDERRSSKRADVIVVTKCPSHLSAVEKTKIAGEIGFTKKGEVFFTSLHYGFPYHFIHKKNRVVNAQTQILLVCAIADPEPIFQHLAITGAHVEKMYFQDHHIFSRGNIKEIQLRFKQLDAVDKVIITTEKDLVRLLEFKDEIKELPIYVLPVAHRFLFGGGTRFESIVTNFIETFPSDNRKI